MKNILVLILLLIGIKLSAQIPFEMGASKVDAVYFNESTRWLKGFKHDVTFAGNDSTVAPSERAVVSYVAAQIAAITAGVTDTAEVIRLIGAYLDTVNISFTASYDAVGDTLITYFNGDWGYTLSTTSTLQDSIDAHTDSLQSHNIRIKYNRTKVNTLTDTTLAHNTRLKAMELILF